MFIYIQLHKKTPGPIKVWNSPPPISKLQCPYVVYCLSCVPFHAIFFQRSFFRQPVYLGIVALVSHACGSELMNE